MQHRDFTHALREPPQAPSRSPRARRLRRRVAAATGALGVLGGAGCSLLYDLDSEQCSSNADCSRFGAGYTCSAVQVCEAPQVGVAASGGNGGSAGAGGNGGAAGTPPGPECTTNGQCIDSHGNQPFVCRNETCVDLLSDECPFAIGLDNLRSDNPIIIGAYTAIDPESVTNSVVTANYTFALDEFTTNAPGGGLQGGARKIAMVACDGINSSSFSASLDHLIDTVQVPAVIAPLLAPDLVSLFTSKGRASNVFFLSPIDADSSLTRLADDGLIWNILGSYAQLELSYVPLLERAEAYIRDKQGLQPSDSVRVALLDDETTAQRDISAEMTGTQTPLFVNGKAVTDPTNTDASNSTCGQTQDQPCPNFMYRTIPSAGVPADYTDVITDLDEFQPHVVVSVTGEAFATNVLDSLETLWDDVANPARPFYLLGPNHASLPSVGDAILAGNATPCDGELCPLRGRVLGINFESARDPAIVNSYRTRFAGTYSQYPTNFENFYDAAWYMMYAIAAAGDVPLTGDAIARGMGRLVRTQPDRLFQVGPSDVEDVLFTLGSLSSANGIQLDGTMGPPDFDPESGARKTQGSGYCINVIASNALFVYDVLRYESGGTPSMTPGSSSSPSTCVPADF